jgi:CheY-like chemotaxis protein/two-component sensor histidine kinase
MSRIVSGKLRLDIQPTNLSNVIDAAIQSILPAAEAKQIALRKIIDPRAGMVTGDSARLQQVIWNLLSNAVKFTPKQGQVQILLERVNSHLELTVADSGQGIDPEFLPYLFERFRQADASTTRRHGGLGLGLSIAKHLVELHGGSIRASSPGAGLGTTIVISLPLRILQEEPEQPREQPVADVPTTTTQEVRLDGVTVLAVDDEADARDLLRYILEGAGARVLSSSSVEEALDLLRQGGIDVVLSDIGMPLEDGYSLIRKIRQLPDDGSRRIPAVALTAFARGDDRRRALVAGFNMHVAKPVEPAELVAVVGSLAGRL